MEIVDTRGRSCPEPVLMTKHALSEFDTFKVLIDENVAKENILRLLNKMNCSVDLTEDGEEFSLIVKK